MSEQNTYTYTARNAEHPEKMVTFTLHDRWLSVGAGDPVALMEQTVESVTPDEDGAEESPTSQLWLKPLAISLVERSTAPFHIRDIDVDVDDDWLRVRGWPRVGGLRLTSLTMIEGPIDNPLAAQAFAREVAERKAEIGGDVFLLLDYWLTWIVALGSLVAAFTFWRRRNS